MKRFNLGLYLHLNNKMRKQMVHHIKGSYHFTILVLHRLSHMDLFYDTDIGLYGSS